LLCAIAIAVERLRGLMQLLPPALVLGGRSFIALAVFIRSLTRETMVVFQPIGTEPARRHRSGDCAARLAVVRAIGEPAGPCQARHVAERDLEAAAVEP